MAEQLLTQDEFRLALEELGIAQREFSRMAHVNERTVRSWVSERNEPPNSASVVLLYLLGSGVSAEKFTRAVEAGKQRIYAPA